jgi:hypothetical protein
MAVTLGDTLLTAQNNISRKPRINLVSSQAVDDIPFDGTFLTSDTHNETQPFCLYHSTGRMIVFYQYRESNLDWGMKVYITNVARTTFEKTVTINIDYSTGNLYGITAEELSNTNIGILYFEKSDTTRYLKYRIITNFNS